MRRRRRRRSMTTEENKFWAICRFYEPFTMGGDVWQWCRFQVEGKPLRMLRDIQAFIFFDDVSKRWKVHEAGTGGFLGEGATDMDATYHANKNIELTPDLEEQIKGLGDTGRFPVVEKDEALCRLAKSGGRGQKNV
jgi:hypothetical protein